MIKLPRKGCAPSIILILLCIIWLGASCQRPPIEQPPIRINGVETTGSVVTHGSSANSGSTSVTVPADATCAIVFWSGWFGSGTPSMSSISLGSSMTIVENAAVSGGTSARGCAILVNPSTGSQTFAWDWSGTATLDEGCPYMIRFFKGVNTGDPIRDSDNTGWTGTATNSVTLTTSSDDYVVGVVQSYFAGTGQNPEGAPAGSGQTVDEDNFDSGNSEFADLAHEDSPGESSTDFSGTGHFGTIVAVVLKQAPAGGGGEFHPGRKPWGNLIR